MKQQSDSLFICNQIQCVVSSKERRSMHVSARNWCLVIFFCAHWYPTKHEYGYPYSHSSLMWMLKGMYLNPLIVTFLYVTPYPYSKKKTEYPTIGCKCGEYTHDEGN